MLGKACNLKCIYCHQGQEKPLAVDTEVDPKAVAAYFPKGGTIDVVFYGGEPLLYFDYMTQIAAEIKERNSNAILRTITNGTLLTMEKAKRLNELGFSVGVSHDGFAFEATRRTGDFLKHNPEPFLMLKRRSIIAVVTTLNPNFYDVWNYFEEFSQRNKSQRESIYFSIACDIDHKTDPKLIISGNKAYEAMLDRVFVNLEKAIRANDWEAYEFRHYRQMLSTLNYKLNNPESCGSWCGADQSVCHIDIHGNLYLCHNVDKPNGHISRDGIQPGRYNPFINTKKCQECQALIYCGGGCVASPPETHDAECYGVYQQVIRMLAMLERLKDGGW